MTTIKGQATVKMQSGVNKNNHLTTIILGSQGALIVPGSLRYCYRGYERDKNHKPKLMVAIRLVEKRRRKNKKGETEKKIGRDMAVLV